jgi:hypothetical protein
LLKNVNLQSFKFLGVYKTQDAGEELLCIAVCFEHNQELLSMEFQLKRQEKAWLVKSILFSYIYGENLRVNFGNWEINPTTL